MDLVKWPPKELMIYVPYWDYAFVRYMAPFYANLCEARNKETISGG